MRIISKGRTAFDRLETSSGVVCGGRRACLVSIDPAAAIDYIQLIPGRAAKWVWYRFGLHAQREDRRVGKASGRMAPAFAAERTLGRLGKWLRLLGFDTIIETECSRGRFFEYGGGRILLTRTRSVMTAQAALKPVLIRANDPFEQLGEVIRAAALTPEDLRPFTRCLRCNEPIVPVPKAEVQRSVPDYVWQRHSEFSTCPLCGRLYWPGTHTARSLERIEKQFR